MKTIIVSREKETNAIIRVQVDTTHTQEEIDNAIEKNNKENERIYFKKLVIDENDIIYDIISFLLGRDNYKKYKNIDTLCGMVEEIRDSCFCLETFLNNVNKFIKDLEL